MIDIVEHIKQLKKIADSVPCGIGIFDAVTSEPIFLNKTYYKLFGCTEQNADAIKNKSDILISETINGSEHKISRDDGSFCWVKLTVSDILIEGRQYKIAVLTDITVEKESSSVLSLIAENVGTSLSLIKMTKGKTDIIYANEAFYRNTGISPEIYRSNMDIINRTAVSDEDYELIMKATNDSLHTGKTAEVTHKYVCPNGRILWLNRRFAAIPQGGDDSYLLVSAVTNITDIKEKELESAIEKRRFQTVINELNAAVFEWDLITNDFYCSEAYKNYAFSQISQEDILNNRGPLDVVHPDDVPILKEFFEESKSGKEKTEVTLRLKTIDGAFRWCRMIGYYYHGDNGEPVRTIGVVIDVNEEHERSFMLSSILNELPGGVAILYYAEEMKCQYFNDRFATLNGRTRKEVEEIINDGTFMEIVVAPSDYERLMETLKECITVGAPINITYRFLHKNGTVHWIHLSGTKIREENGFPVYYCIFTTPSEEAELYREVVEDSPVGVIVLDKIKRNILYINDIGKELYNVLNEDILNGRSVFDVLKEHNEKPILSESEIDNLEYDRYSEFNGTRSGKYLSFRARAIVWNSIDSYVIYVSDETKEHEEQVRLQKLINGVPTGIGIYEVNGTQISLVYLNDAFYREIGMSRESLSIFSGIHTIEAVHPDDINGVYEMVRSMMDGSDTGDHLVRLSNIKKEWIWFKLSCSVVERRESHIRAYVSFTNCNEIVLAQQKLEENRIKEQIMLSTIPGGVVVYRLKKTGRVFIEYVSEGFAKLMGYQSANELNDDVKGDAESRIPKKDAQALREHVMASLEKHEAISFIYNVYTRTNSLMKIRMDANVMTEAQMDSDDIALLYAVHTVVSKESQKAMEEQKRYRALMGALDVALMEWDLEKGFFASEKYMTYEISKEDFKKVMRNKANKSIVHQDDLPVLEEFFKECEKKPQKVSCVLRMKMVDGTFRWTEMQGFIEYNIDGNPKRLIGVLRDVDKERIEQNERLKNALDEAKKANEAKSDFLSRVSHDMRTPLNGILGIAGIMRESITDEKTLADLSQMELSGQYLLNLINDTLDVSRIESGKMELHPSVCDGADIFESVIALSKPAIEAKHLHSEYITDGLTFPLLYIDIGRVQQIMLNILGNAAKFTPDGGHIRCTMKNISVENNTHIDEVCIEDDGIGMSEEFLPHIFDAFSQADSSKKNSRQGTGLGMIITKQLVELMGGTISVESKLGVGTKITFTLVLPIATDEQIDAWKKSQKTETEEVVLTGKNILLCEDHPLNAKITLRLLNKKGINVTHAENGEIGYNIFLNSDIGYFDAILMDIRMPVMDGLETSAAIRSLDREDAKTVPIIAVTANAFDEDIKETERAGMNAHFSKPIDAQKLYGTLNRLLKT